MNIRPIKVNNPKLEDAYKAPFTQWKTSPTPANASALLEAVSPVLDTAVFSYGGGSKSPTLKSQAKQLALDAFTRYDDTKGSLKNHLLGHLQRLRRYSQQEQQIIRLPERVSSERLQLDDTTNQLTDDLGRPPTDKELQRHLGISKQRITKLRTLPQAVSEGLLQGSDPANTYTPASTGLGTSKDAQVWIDMIYDDLPPVDQLIMERALGLHGRQKMPVQAIAKQLRISPSAVSQRLPALQKKLDEMQTLQGY